MIGHSLGRMEPRCAPSTREAGWDATHDKNTIFGFGGRFEKEAHCNDVRAAVEAWGGVEVAR